MLLAERQIQAAVDSGNIKIDRFAADSLQPASYDLRLGPEAFASSAKRKLSVKEQGILILESGDFSMVVTDERLTLDDQHAARFGIRSSLSRQGLVPAIGPGSILDSLAACTLA